MPLKLLPEFKKRKEIKHNTAQLKTSWKVCNKSNIKIETDLFSKIFWIFLDK